MTRTAGVLGLFGVLILVILGSAVVTNKVACERGIKGRQSLIALREGFEASAHGRYEKARARLATPPTPKAQVVLSVEEEKEGAGLYTFAHRITVHPPNCAGIFPRNK